MIRLTYLYMCHPMIVQVGTGCEPLPAVLALMWLLPRVYSSVCVETAWCAEPLVAYHTHMRFLTWKRLVKSILLLEFYVLVSYLSAIFMTKVQKMGSFLHPLSMAHSSKFFFLRSRYLKRLDIYLFSRK